MIISMLSDLESHFSLFEDPLTLISGKCDVDVKNISKYKCTGMRYSVYVKYICYAKKSTCMIFFGLVCEYICTG